MQRQLFTWGPGSLGEELGPGSGLAVERGHSLLLQVWVVRLPVTLCIAPCHSLASRKAPCHSLARLSTTPAPASWKTRAASSCSTAAGRDSSRWADYRCHLSPVLYCTVLHVTPVVTCQTPSTCNGRPTVQRRSFRHLQHQHKTWHHYWLFDKES